MLDNRVQKMTAMMANQSISQLIISDPSSIFYLTGKWFHPGERMLVLVLNQNGRATLVINELFPLTEDLGTDVLWFKDTDDAIKALAPIIAENVVTGIDKNWPSHFLLRLMAERKNNTFVLGSPIVDTVRMCKDEAEKDHMRLASSLNDQAMAQMVERVKLEYSELEMVKELMTIYENLETEGPSFGPIVGYGANAADPHHDCDHSKPVLGGSVVIDIGCKKNSYCSDMTRTIFFGEPDAESKKVYETVKEANMRAIAAVKPGVKFSDIDNAARNFIEEQGYGQYFTHRTGHSIGIDVHDYGDVSGINHDILKPGMIFSIEPGIYLPGKVGVRIEDLVLVTDEGCEVLNQFSKDMIIV